MSSPQAERGTEPQPAPRRNIAGTLNYWRNRALPSKPAPPGRAKTNLSVTLRLWHKRFGLFAFVFMGWLGFSGILINESAGFGYDTYKLHWSWVMALYGLHPEPPTTGFLADGHWLTETLDATLLDGKPLAQRIPRQVGMAEGGTADQPLLFVAESNRVVVLSPTGALVDEMAGYTLPISSISRIGMVKGPKKTVAIMDKEAYSTSDGLQWDKLPANAEVIWAEPQPLPAPEQAKALPYSRPSVTLEHVLVDAHSGRIFGAFGAWVINFVGAAAILLSISGIWIVWRTNKQRQGRR